LSGDRSNLRQAGETRVMLPAQDWEIPQLSAAAEDAAQAIRDRWPVRPRVGLILGTGLGALARAIAAETSISYRDIPYFSRSTALSHRGRLVCGDLQGTPVIAMEGRCHLYEGYGLAELMTPVFALRALGVQLLVISNASGGLNPQFRSGDVMILEDHINLMFCAPWPGFTSTRGSGADPSNSAAQKPGWLPSASRPAYCPQLIEIALGVARQENFAAHRGVYAAVSGPNYETRAEYRFLRRIGADAVGMSTVPEAIAASLCGLRTLGLSVITNIARPDAPAGVEAEDVVRAAAGAERHLRSIARAVVAASSPGPVD
jgi:purine-nucleoside phosphorylase